MKSKPWTVAEIQGKLAARRSDLARLGGLSPAVFGSVARGQATGDSDIDFLVAFTGGAALARYMDLKLLLESLFGRPVDLVTRRSSRPRLQPFVEKEAVRVA